MSQDKASLVFQSERDPPFPAPPQVDKYKFQSSPAYESGAVHAFAPALGGTAWSEATFRTQDALPYRPGRSPRLNSGEAQRSQGSQQYLPGASFRPTPVAARESQDSQQYLHGASFRPAPATTFPSPDMQQHVMRPSYQPKQEPEATQGSQDLAAISQDLLPASFRDPDEPKHDISKQEESPARTGVNKTESLISLASSKVAEPGDVDTTVETPDALTDTPPDVKHNTANVLSDEMKEIPIETNNAQTETQPEIDHYPTLIPSRPIFLKEDESITATPQSMIRQPKDSSNNPFASPSFNRMGHFDKLSDVKPKETATAPSIVPPATQLQGRPPLVATHDSGANGIPSVQDQNSLEYITRQPTCTLNLVCYRARAKGCELHQIHTVLSSRFENTEAFKTAIAVNPSLIPNDTAFFQALRDVYLRKMCGFWRRNFFLKTLRGVRLLSFTPTSRPAVVPLDDFVLQEILFAYQNPSKITTEHEWIDWVFRLRQTDRRHALEFVEGWNGTRIAIAGSIPLIFSTVIGIVWSVRGSGIQDGFAIAGFVLTAGSLLMALLAVISGIEASGRLSS